MVCAAWAPQQASRLLLCLKSQINLLWHVTCPYSLCAPLHPQVLVHDGVRCLGTTAICAKLREVAQMNSGFKIEHEVLHVDCQPLGSVSGGVGVGKCEACGKVWGAGMTGRWCK